MKKAFSSILVTLFAAFAVRGENADSSLMDKVSASPAADEVNAALRRLGGRAHHGFVQLPD